jgi:molybdopterin biosynthesis enzyme MoaB
MPELNDKYRGLLRYDTAPDTDPAVGGTGVTPDDITPKEETTE